jgi:DNA-binding CsgD family transcriptional regulator
MPRDYEARRICTATHKYIVSEFARRHGLSDRQAQIVGGAIRGFSSKEIAAELNIDYRTVAEHLARVCDKAGAADRHQLVASIVDLVVEMLDELSSQVHAAEFKKTG